MNQAILGLLLAPVVYLLGRLAGAPEGTMAIVALAVFAGGVAIGALKSVGTKRPATSQGGATPAATPAPATTPAKSATAPAKVDWSGLPYLMFSVGGMALLLWLGYNLVNCGRSASEQILQAAPTEHRQITQPLPLGHDNSGYLRETTSCSEDLSPSLDYIDCFGVRPGQKWMLTGASYDLQWRIKIRGDEPWYLLAKADMGKHFPVDSYGMLQLRSGVSQPVRVVRLGR